MIANAKRANASDKCAAVTSMPIADNRGGCSQPHAAVSWLAIHSAVGCASQAFGNRWQTQPRTNLSTVRNDSRLRLPRRSTMTCCRNTRISASTAVRGRSRSTTIQKIILQRCNIPQRIIRFCVSRQLHRIYDRDTASSRPSTSPRVFWQPLRGYVPHARATARRPRST